MPQSPSTSSVPAPLVALLSWLVPGSGYWLIGQKLRGTVIGVTIIILFVLGILISGIRVIDVPGYDDRGERVYVGPSGQKVSTPSAGDQWTLYSRPFAEIANKPWFIGQVLTGPLCIAAAWWSVDVSRPISSNDLTPAVPRSHARVAEIGTLYTAVAGMLNLLAIIDAAYRAGREGR